MTQIYKLNFKITLKLNKIVVNIQVILNTPLTRTIWQQNTYYTILGA